MSRKIYQPSGRVTDRLHPGLIWRSWRWPRGSCFRPWAFAGSAYSDYLLAVASGLIVTTIALPAAVWRNWRHHPHEKEEPSGSFRE